MTLFQDANLIAYIPFIEPSGVGVFKNFAPSGIAKPSGISFDLHTHIVSADTNQPQSFWPGTETVFNISSGVSYAGYKVQGSGLNWAIVAGTAEDKPGQLDKVLVLGQGGFSNRHICVPPTSAQSGFTVGYWVYPNSDGAANHISRGSMSNALLSKAHALIAKCDNTTGFLLGISGKQNKATQFNSNPRDFELKAYAHVLNNARHLSIPIESGRFTHLTFVYRGVAGANQVSLFKDGKLSDNDRTGIAEPAYSSSGTTTTNLNDSVSTYRDRLFTVGGTTNNNPATDVYSLCTGWGHLVSGLYIYSRPLNEDEIATLHDQGGLQPNFGLLKPITPIILSDPSIISYYPGISPGYIDISKNHFNLWSDQDEGVSNEGVTSKIIIVPGPNNGAMWQPITNTGVDLAIVGGSGLTNAITASQSFTIAGHFHHRSSTTFPNNTFCSFGSIGSVEGGPGAGGTQSAGFHISTSGAAGAVQYAARTSREGHSKSELVLRGQDKDLWAGSTTHIAYVYDDQTFGTALYLNGELAESGNLLTSASANNIALGGQGYPLVFLNGVLDTIIDTMSNTADDANAIGNIFIAGRPLLESEIRFLAQSGIDITPLNFTVQDPRLRGYWKCTDSTSNDFVIRDRARVFGFPNIPGNLVKCTSNVLWNQVQTTDNKGPQYRIDIFNSGIHPTLGITSGTWSVMGASDGTHPFTTPGSRARTSSSDFTQRYRPMAENRANRGPSTINQLIWGFDVTPSGTIPATYDSIGREHNSLLVEFGEGSTNNRLYSFLTTNDASIGSGVTLVWMAKDATTPTTQGLVSGTIPYGITSRMMFHAVALFPNIEPGNSTNYPVQFSLYNSGVLVNRKLVNNNASLFYSDGAFGGTADDWFTIIGGRDLSDTGTTHSTNYGGLGGIYLKDIFCMVGTFTQSGIQHLSTSGITTTTPFTYDNDIPTSSVTIGDTGLEGYWRFSDSGSGIRDYSTKGHDLRHLAREAANAGAFPSSSNAANNLRYVATMFGANTTPMVPGRASGITYANKTFTTPNAIAPFAASGTAYDDANNGFTAGFWLCQRASVSVVGDADIIMSFGPTPTASNSTASINASWAVVIDDSNTIKMLLSKNGSLPLDNASATTNVTECAIYRDTGTARPDNCIEIQNKGFIEPPHIDSWQHLIWSYNRSENKLKGYLNGALVNERLVPPSGFHIPELPEARIMSLLVPMSNTWTWDVTLAAFNEVISLPFYMSRAITDAEAAQITFYDFNQAASASGLIGGYIAGQDTVSGIIGGYLDGIDTISGLIGGYVATTALASGIIGGYIAGKDSLSGVVGGYLQSVVILSGLIGGYVSAKNLVSGIVGCYLNSALTSTVSFDAKFTVGAAASKDFDAFIEIQRASRSDFDAQIILFQEELPPGVDIIVPASTVSNVSIPFKQYFVGSGTAIQGKTISQATWDWGDLTPTESAFVSGINGDLYPGNHIFQSSGFYIVRFTIYDSNGIQNTASRIIDCSSGITPVLISLSGNPRFGPAPLQVQFSQVFESIPGGVSILSSLLKFDDMTSTNTFGALHTYQEPGRYLPLWVVKDSRGVIWGDSLEVGVNG